MLIRSPNGVLEHVNQSDVLFEIEELVNFIAENYQRNSPWVDREVFSEAYYQNLFEKLPLYFSVYDPDCGYDKPIAIFMTLAITTGLFEYLDEVMTKQQRYEWIVLDDFVRLIGFHTRQNTFKRAASDRRYELEQRTDSLTQNSEDLHRRYARLLVIRIDFGYLKESLKQIDVQTFYRHQEKLSKSIEVNSVFDNLVGHARSLEQAKDRGWHSHAVLYFKGDKHQNDFALIEQIRKIWANITAGHGSIYSPNLDKEKYEKQGALGVGMIHRDQPDEVANAIKAVKYLTRPDKDQHLRMRPRGRRIFFAGIKKK